MPDTLTLPPGAPVTEEEPPLHVCVWDHVARTVARLDAANGRSPHQTAVRVMKIAEETGRRWPPTSAWPPPTPVKVRPPARTT